MKKNEGGTGGRKMPQKFLREIFSGRIVFSSLPVANVEEYKLPVPPEHAQSQSAAVAQTKAELREGRSAMRASGCQFREEGAK